MKHDILSREDIIHLLHNFYTKVMQDEDIGYLFTEVARLDMEVHIPRIADFWESVLFHTVPYAHNAMHTHTELHKKSPLQQRHFDKWLYLWQQSLEELFQGANAERALSIAKNIASVMMTKITGSFLPIR